MLKFKNYHSFLKLFVLSVTIWSFTHCSKTTYQVNQVESNRIGVTRDAGEDKTLSQFILPYKQHIDRDLDSILCYNPETLEKSKGKWQTNIGDWMATVCFEHANPLFKARTGKTIDICLLNHGGIRAILPKGNISARNAYEIMPFENNLVVIGLTFEKIVELTEYFVSEKKPHPIYGMSISFDKEQNITDVKIHGESLQKDRIYYVLTSDYLSSGGDNMTFFQNPISSYDLDYKIRNVLIDEFKSKDTLIIPSERKIFEQ